MDDGDDGRRTGDGRADGVVVRGARGDGSGGGGLRTLTVCGGRSEDLVRTLEISPWGTFGDFLTGERALSVWKPLFATNVTLRCYDVTIIESMLRCYDVTIIESMLRCYDY